MFYLDKQRIISLALAILYVIFFKVSPTRYDPGLFFPVVIGLGLIWFGDELGGMTGYYVKYHRVDKESPGCLVQFLGWLFMLLPLVVVIFGMFGDA